MKAHSFFIIPALLLGSCAVMASYLPITTGSALILVLSGAVSALLYLYFTVLRPVCALLRRYNVPQADSIAAALEAELQKREQAHRASEEALAHARSDLQSLISNVPGGVHRTTFDRYLSFDFISEGYLSMIGYSARQVRSIFDNQFYFTVYEEDRARVMRAVEVQTSEGDTIELEYRVVRADGTIIWVMDKGRVVQDSEGRPWLYCILIDVTSSKQAQEELYRSEERHRIIMDQTEDIIFEWDVLEDRMTFSSNWARKFGRDPEQEHLVDAVCDGENVHPEDQAAIRSLLRDVRAGALLYGQAELRFRRAGGDYLWCRLRLSGILDDAGKVCRAVGVIVDIDAEKRSSLHLIQKAQRDPLTKLTNKNTTKALVEQLLESEENGVHALYIIDLDDFKTVNDSMGHLFGDAVLSNTAAHIGELFGQGDIIGRIGGDEFLVFAPKITTRAAAEKKAEQLVQGLRQSFQGHGATRCMSASVGLALYPEDGRMYPALFQSADIALYNAKKRGKSCYSSYSLALAAGGSFLPPTGQSHAGTAVDGHATDTLSVIRHIFRILHETQDVPSAVQLILEITGRYFGVSRAYVFENTDDNLYCNNTFEWCAEGVQPQRAALQNMAYANLSDYAANFDENGVFYCRDVRQLPQNIFELLEPQNICAMLQCAILDDGAFRGYVGFDECSAARLWTQDEVDTLTLTAQTLSIFLLKRNAQIRLAAAFDLHKQVLDNMDTWTYVIEPESYRLLYMNRKTQALAPRAKIGDLCYEVFFGGRKSPCARCPARQLSDTGQNCTLEVENAVFGVWSAATASDIVWNHRKSILLSCNDITAYKQACPSRAASGEPVL